MNGDATRIDELRLASKKQLDSAGQALGGELSFGRDTCLRVLRDWRAEHLSDEQVRWWALLMFIGAFPDEWTPYGWHANFHSAQPIHVDYSDDERVNEVVFRLKDLGAFDDEGRIASELDDMMANLSDPETNHLLRRTPTQPWNTLVGRARFELAVSWSQTRPVGLPNLSRS